MTGIDARSVDAGEPVTSHDSPETAVFDRKHLKKQRRAAVLRAAAQAFTRKGFSNTTLDDVAQELDVSKPTLYRYFPSKQKILFACHQHSMDHGETALALALADGGTGHEQFEIFTRRYMMGIFDDFGTCAILADVDSLSPEDKKIVVQRRHDISRRTMGLIETGIADGSIRQCNAKLASLFALGAINWVALWYRRGGENTPEEIIESFLAFLTDGLLPPTDAGGGSL